MLSPGCFRNLRSATLNKRGLKLERYDRSVVDVGVKGMAEVEEMLGCPTSSC
jgi:hypothetical protein